MAFREARVDLDRLLKGGHLLGCPSQPLVEAAQVERRLVGGGVELEFLLVLALGQRRVPARLARRGLELDPASSVAPLGHFVVAGVLMKQGHAEAAARELEAGRALEARAARKDRLP